jgi:hypothetical protein
MSISLQSGDRLVSAFLSLPPPTLTNHSHSVEYATGLLRGFKGEIIQSSVDVEEIDLELMASETQSWASDFSADDTEAPAQATVGKGEGEEGKGVSVHISIFPPCVCMRACCVACMWVCLVLHECEG